MQRTFLLPLLALSSLAHADDVNEPLRRKSVFGAQFAVAEGKGIEIKGVLPKLTAEAAGFKAGDILVSVDGTALAAPANLTLALRTKYAGDSVTIEYLREGKKESKKVKLAPRPMQQSTDTMEVKYSQVVSNGKRIRLILTHPKKPGKYPLVMLVGGIGAYSVDGEFPAFPYGEILGPLAAEGYATARIDKPGQGDSEGPVYAELGFNTELDAYRQAIKALPSFDFVNPDKIAIYGHSMGGAFGPLLGAELKLAGVVAASTMVKSWPEYMLENTRRQMILAGSPESEISGFVRQLDAVSHYFFYEGKTADQVIKERPELAAVVKDLVPDGKTYSGVGLPFFKELADHDTAAAWSKVTAKVLLLCGANDFVASEQDHPIIARIVNAAHPGNAEYVQVPESDHAFRKATSWPDAFRSRMSGPFNPAVLDTLKAWLKKTIGS